MPIVIPQDLPAFNTLTKENIFVMNDSRALSQDIRPLDIAIVNLMPTKIETETQLLRVLGNSPLQVNITLIKTESYVSKNASESHLERFYTTFSEIKNRKFDGMIVTGAPVETFEFSEVDYWEELCGIMDYAKECVTSTVFICWGAQAAMQRYYGIGKEVLTKKMFGVFKNRQTVENEPLLRGLDDYFNVPHSRHTKVDEDAIRKNKNLTVLAEGNTCGISIAKSNDNKAFFFFGHSEYDRETLKKEYLRDVDKNLDIDRPHRYFSDDGTENVDFSWRSTGSLLFNNWLNYYVYQVTPYSLV